MLRNKIKIRKSLSLKVLLTSVAFSILIATVIGVSIHNRVSATIINEKISISKIETANALYLAQGHFNLARFQNDAGLNKVVQDFITSSREDGSLSGRETVILPVVEGNNKQNIYQTVPTLLVLDSIPESFREQVRKADEVLDKRVRIRYSDGKEFPGFLIGGKLNIPRTGIYEIYYLFKLNAQYDSISVITWTLLGAGLLLVLLIGLSTQFVIRQVVAPVQQAAAVAEMTEDFKSATATYLTEYRGLTVTSMKQLRRSLGADTKYAVVKNTLTKIAAKGAGVEISDDLLAGPSALAFVKGDPIDAARHLKNFQKENPLLIIKGGIYEGKLVTTAEIMKLADLESREVLLAKLAGAMKGSLAKAARIFDALRIKMEAGAPVAAAPAAVVEAPAAPAVEEAAPAAEAVAEVTEEVVAEVAAEATDAAETPAE